MRPFTPLPFALCLAAFLTASLFARVGETKTSLEARLLGGGSAGRIPEHELVPEKKKELTRPIDGEYVFSLGSISRPDGGTVMSPLPLFALMPESFKTSAVFYLKTDNGKSTGLNIVSLRNWKPNMRPSDPRYKKPKNTDAVLDDTLQRLFYDFTGWELMVLYVNDVSVLEAYRRIGRYIISPEVNGILQVNGGDIKWKPVPPAQRVPSLIPYDFETEDGRLRAAAQGGERMTTLIIFNAQMADKLKEVSGEKRRQMIEEKSPAVTQSIDKF